MSALASSPRIGPPAGTERLLAGMHADRATSLPEHLTRLGPLPDRRTAWRALEDSGLRGRGGAAFPTARKVRSVTASGRAAAVVANGAEGEPASGKDKLLLRLSPHLVLDGLAAAAACVGATEAIVAIPQGARPELAALRHALGERARGSVPMRVAVVPDAFVSGEETALLQALGGGKAKPTAKPPYPFERGLRGAPTLVQNVETLAHLALLARFGAGWFRSAGTSSAPGTALVTLSGAIHRSGVHEVEFGSTLGDLIRRIGGLSEPVTGFLVGGYFGRWIPGDDASALPLLPESLGAGAIVALPERTCALAECARIVRYLAEESAGQCGPCVHGLAAVAGAFDRLVHGDDQAVAQLSRWTAQIRGRGGCRHPDGASNFVESALEAFASEVDAHIRRGRCARTYQAVLPVPRRRR